MKYPVNCVVHSFESNGYRVEFRSTGNSIALRVFETKTGTEVTPEQLDVGFRLRIQDEQEKAAELIRRQARETEIQRIRQNRIRWDAFQKRRRTLERPYDERSRRTFERD